MYKWFKMTHNTQATFRVEHKGEISRGYYRIDSGQIKKQSSML